MGSKYKTAFLSLFIVSFFFLQCCKMTENYSDKILSAFQEKQTVNVEDIFSFDFDLAYVFNDYYISGEGFAQRYDLEIYTFKYDTNSLIVSEEGCIIHPETVIENMGAQQTASFPQKAKKYVSKC